MSDDLTVYKLTDGNSRTYGGCQWGEGVTHTTSGEGDLCGPGWLHFYLTLELAALLHPLHVRFKNPILWEATRGKAVRFDGQLKGGTTQLTTLRQIPLPDATPEVSTRFAIFCALEFTQSPSFVRWAVNWLNGSDRSAEAARAEATRADAARAEAAWAAAEAADLPTLARQAFDLSYRHPLQDEETL